MTWLTADGAGTGSDLFAGGFSWGTFLLVVGMFVALAVVSSLGILARMRDRSMKARRAAPQPTGPASTGDRDGATTS